MSFINIDGSRYAVDAPVSTDLFGDIVNDLNYLNGIQSSSDSAGGAPLIINGSFEMDTPISGTLTGWTYSSSGGSGVVTATNQDHGAQSFWVTQNPLSGGGTLTSANNFYVSGNSSYLLRWDLMSTQTAVKNVVSITYYFADGSPTGVTVNGPTITLNAANVWQTFQWVITPPSPLYTFASLTFDLGDSSVSPPSTAGIYLDNVSMIQRLPFTSAQVFTSSGTFTPPGGVYQILVEMLGGGGGADSGDFFSTGKKGWGGSYSKGFLNVTPNLSYTVTVGGSVGNKATGQDTSIKLGSTTLMIAHGGSAGQNGNSSTASGGYLNISAIDFGNSGWPRTLPPVVLGGSYGFGGDLGAGGSNSHGGIVIVRF